MARKLTQSQKTILVTAFNKRTDKHFIDFDSLSLEEQTKLVSINDYETLWMDADRFLSDLLMQEQYG